MRARECHTYIQKYRSIFSYTCVNRHVNTYTHIYRGMRIHVYEYIYIYICVCMYIHIFVYIHIQMNMDTWKHTDIYINIYIYMFECICIYKCMYMCGRDICTYVPMNTHMYTHTCI